MSLPTAVDVPYANDDDNDDGGGGGVEQFVRLYRAPAAHSGDDGSSATDVAFAILHGGYFKAKYGVDNSGVASLVPFLVSRGHTVALVEYRRVGHPGGGWPGTNADVVRGLNKFHELLTEDGRTARIAVVGHSAGGTLALWACASGREAASAGVAPPLAFVPLVCVAVAPVGDLEAGHRRRLSDEGDAIYNYMGQVEPAADDAATSCPYRRASPHRLLPMATPLLVVAGTADVDVPADVVTEFYDQVLASEASVASSASTALLVLPGADHFDVVNAATPAWVQIYEAVLPFIELK
jgi:acetyl esterase/lipase